MVVGLKVTFTLQDSPGARVFLDPDFRVKIEGDAVCIATRDGEVGFFVAHIGDRECPGLAGVPTGTLIPNLSEWGLKLN